MLKNLNPRNVIVLGGEAFGKLLSHEGGVHMNGISDLLKESPGR